ncbi:MAG TPA: hypothetical protein DCS38_00705 [Ruminococcus sp.]|nr:hypothetical protein [Ruminococcus sp.]
MDIKKIIYFSLSALVLVFVGIILADDEKPAEIPAVVTFPAASAYTVSAVSQSVSTASDESEILTAVSVSEKETVSEITSVSSDETEFSESTDISFPINLNTASRDELMLIDGIGESTADKIIEYRERNGGFASVSQLIEINGIGEAKLEKFRSFLYVEGDTGFVDEPQNNDGNDYQEDYNTPDDNSHDDNNNNDIPDEEQTQPPVEETFPEDTEIPMVELNSATAEDFMKLPGIDEEMAYKIVEFREKIQYFSHPYELLYIDGMTEKILSGAIDYMYIEGKEDIIY